MRLPRKMNVSGYDLTIKFSDKVFVEGDECYGFYDPKKKLIVLKRGMSDTRKREIFLHEYVHFLEDIYRISISDENVGVLSLGILQLINTVDLK